MHMGTWSSPGNGILRRIGIGMAFIGVAVAFPKAAITSEGGYAPSASETGGTVYLDPSGASSIRVKTIDNNYYRPGPQSGTTVNGVNLMTGQPWYQVPIGNIGAGGETVFPIAFTFGGPIRQQYDADNDRGPTSWIGYGWNFSAPFVAINHKGTLTYDDDVFFCDLGPYGGGQILQGQDAGGQVKYFVSGNPSIKVIPSFDADGFIADWEFIAPTGVRLVFGKNDNGNNSKRTLLRTANVLGASPYTLAGAKDFIYRWDISTMSDNARKNRLVFKYNRTQKVLGGAAGYTQESYLQDVISMNAANAEIERYSFVTAGKQSGVEYPIPSGADVQSQKLFETKRLDRIQHFSEGTMDRVYVLTQPVKTAAAPDFPYNKMRLTKIDVQVQNPRNGAWVSVPKLGWAFEYDETANRHSGLQTIYKPNFGKDVYTYGRPNYDFFYSTSGPNIYPFRQETGQDQQVHSQNMPSLTANGRALSKWKNQTFCSEKYCLISSEYNDANVDQIYYEVWRTSGNNFVRADLDQVGVPFQETYFSSRQNTFRIIPMGDDFLLVDSKGKGMISYEWDGEKFRHSNIMIKRTNSQGVRTTVPFTAGGTNELKVSYSGTHLIVQDQGFLDACNPGSVIEKSKVYVLQKIKGEWVEQNEMECSDPAPAVNRICALNNNPPSGKTYGETYKSTIGCMEFDGKTLHISAMPSMFHIVDDRTDILFSYALDPIGKGFKNITDQYKDFGASVQRANYPNNWDRNIMQPIAFGGDYFLVKSSVSGTSRFDIMHYDGQFIRQVGSVADRTDALGDAQYGATVNVWPKGDYFLLTDQSAKVAEGYFKQIAKDASGNATGMSFSKVTVRTDLPDAGTGDVVARTSENAFTLEYYPNTGATGGVPSAAPLTDGTLLDNYKTYLYVTDGSLWGSSYFQLVNPATANFRDGYGRNYFDLTFSPSDNLITARKGNISGGTGACVIGNPCATGFVTALTLIGPSGLADKFIRKTTPVYMAGDGPTSSFDQRIISPSARIAAISILNSSTKTSQFLLLKSMGLGYTQYPFQVGSAGLGDVNFVKTFSVYSDLSNAAGPDGDWRTDFQFFYAPQPEFADLTRFPSYNANTQTFTFPNTMVVEFHLTRNSSNTPGKGVAANIYSHLASTQGSPLPDNDLMKQGLVSGTVSRRVGWGVGTFNLGDPYGSTSYAYTTLQRLPGWPENLRLPKLANSEGTVYAPNKSFRKTNVSFRGYYAPANAYLFEISKVGSVWYLKQTLYDPAGAAPSVPIGVQGFRLTGEPSDAELDSWNPKQPYDGKGAIYQGIFSSKYEYDPAFPFQVKTTLAWKDADPSLSDEELAKGVDPIFLLVAGYQTQSKVLRRNANGQVTEVAAILSDEKQLEKHSIAFYEGKASLPVGEVSNAYYDEAAILTAENGALPAMATHDMEGRWGKSDAGPSAKQAHTGRYSIKVIDNQTGPWVDLKLRTAFPQGYELVVSAWIYGESGSPPSLIAERFRAGASTVLQVVRNSTGPVGGAYASGKWQRYEIRIPSAELIGSENLFVSGAGDFLRVRIAAGGTGRVIYVDDIVCRPNLSAFSLTAYDNQGRITSSTNNDHVSHWYEYDALGNRTGVRDDKFRYFNLSALHLPGEND